ncbi:MAG: hypothetical protein K1X89_04785, partial [Myxococcaceae bacterium]|nr:hypothetical protein [Myxococcaceae bacterium]
MASPLVLLLVLGPLPLPKECEPPELRDTAPLKELSNLDSAFSASLDAVATWCFEGSGVWSGGEKAKGAKPGVATGDCARAISSCEEALVTVKGKAQSRELLATALADFDRPFRGLKYAPKRSGLYEKPSAAADCQSKSRGELFAMAQNRMDLARLAGLVLNEYQSYKSWLYTEGLKCRGAVLNKPDGTQRTFAIDTQRDAGPAVAAAAVPDEVKLPERKLDAGSGPSVVTTAAAPALPPAATASAPLAPASPAEREAALKGPWLEKWKFLAREQSLLEGDRDYTQ